MTPREVMLDIFRDISGFQYLSPDDTIEELGIDSLSQMELCYDIEKEFYLQKGTAEKIMSTIYPKTTINEIFQTIDKFLKEQKR